MRTDSPTNILCKYVYPDKVRKVIEFWNESHRKFHTTEHLNTVIASLEKQCDKIRTEDEWEALILAAYFHDAVYVPGEQNNEDLSAEKLMEFCPSDPIVSLAKEIVLSTKKIEKKTGIFDVFQTADCWGLIYWNFQQIVKYEDQIFKEFQRFPWEKYKKGRTEFLENMVNMFPQNKDNLSQLLNYVKTKIPNIGVYAGSFNDFHKGHLNILNQSERIFDKVVVAYGQNPEKEQRTISVPSAISDREITIYNGFLSEVLKRYENMGCVVTLIRGLRNEYDLNYEQNLVAYIKDQMPNLKVVFFLCDKEFEHLSSSSIRALKRFGDDYKRYIVT